MSKSVEVVVLVVVEGVMMEGSIGTVVAMCSNF